MQLPEVNVNIPAVGNCNINASFFRKFDYSSAKVDYMICSFCYWDYMVAVGKFGLAPLECSFTWVIDYICPV